MTWGSASYANAQFDIYKKDFPSDAQHQSLAVQVGGANDTDVVSKLRLALTSHKNIPDIVELNYNEVAEFAAQGELADIQPYVASYLPGLTPASKTLMQYDGHYVAVPYEVEERLWYYRKDMFAAAGIDASQIRTQADFIAAGKKLQAKYPHSYLWNLAASPQQYILLEAAAGDNAQVFDKSTGAFNATSSGLSQVFTDFKQLRESGVVDPNFDDFTPDWQAALANGTLASVPILSWFTSFLPKYAPKLAGDWAVAPWPGIGHVGGGEPGGSVFVIPAGAPHKAAAAKFLADTYMTEKGSLDVDAESGEIPNVTAALSSPSVVNAPYFGPSLIQAYQQVGGGYSAFAYDPAALSEMTILNNALDEYLAGPDASPSAQLSHAQSQLTAQIGNPYTK